MNGSASSLAPTASYRTGLLDHERLDAYRVAVELDGLVARICRSVGRGHGSLCDQALRASASVVLNIAESVGRQGADRAKHVRYARGSALETDAALTLLVHRRACGTDARAAAKELTVRVVAMLTRMMRPTR